MKKDSDVISGIPIVNVWHNHWLWLPSLYMMRGLPYVVLFMTSLVFFSQLGIDNSDIIISNTWLILPFIFRPFLSRVVLSFDSKRYWILLSEFIIGLSFIGIALSIPNRYNLSLSFVFLFVIAIAASIHDIAIEHFYKRNANYRRRSAFMGIRTIFYMCAIVIGFTFPLLAVGYFEVVSRLVKTPWITIFYSLGSVSLICCLYHFIVLPKAYIRAKLPFCVGVTKRWFLDIVQMIMARNGYIYHLLFIFLYLFPEFIFLRIIIFFLFDTGSGGGLGFSPQEVGFIHGAIGYVAILLGAAVGFWAVGKCGVITLRWSMAFAIVLSKLLFLYLSFSFNSSLLIVSLFVFLDYLFAGYSVVMYVLLLLFFTHGKHPTFFYSIGASILGISFFSSSMFIGMLTEYFSYQQIFIFISFLGIIPLFSVKIISINSETDNMFKKFVRLRKIEVFKN